MRIHTATLLFSAVALAFPAQAACDRDRLAAEAGVRHHTELMVGSLLCEGYVPGRSLFNEYRAFTIKHAGVIRGWEGVLAKKMGLARLDRWRTEMANDLSRADKQRAMSEGFVGLCNERLAILDAAVRMSPDEVKALARPSAADLAACAPKKK